MAWQRTRIELPEGLTPGERREVGERIVELIRERTAEGVGIRNGRRYAFPGYSKSYIEREAFKAAGKSPNRVNLRLSEEMMAELRVLSHTPNSVLVGFDNGTDANAKAEGNQIGSYGGSPNPRKARAFLGITQSELRAILGDYE